MSLASNRFGDLADDIITALVLTSDAPLETAGETQLSTDSSSAGEMQLSMDSSGGIRGLLVAQQRRTTQQFDQLKGKLALELSDTRDKLNKNLLDISDLLQASAKE
jgi:hypothetical protein